jgi:3-deoxy-D-manno-octulosonic-acid transferase
MKFDQQVPALPDENVLHGYFGALPENIILFGASTHPGEEELLTDCYVRLREDFPTLKLVLVPRHAERGGDVAAMLEERELNFVRRSMPGLPEQPVDVLLADTTGEMMLLMNGADIVIMGKSFAGHDEGHNLIEPALLGKPIVTGTTLRNFRYILHVLEEHNAVMCCGDGELCGTLEKLAASSELREELSRRASEAISCHRGAVDRTIDVLEEFI